MAVYQPYNRRMSAAYQFYISAAWPAYNEKLGISFRPYMSALYPPYVSHTDAPNMAIFLQLLLFYFYFRISRERNDEELDSCFATFPRLPSSEVSNHGNHSVPR